ncbi:MAG: hypothetical protein ABEK36_04505 [Candidatus Aenigmatarchaeota archaeon]
MKNIEGDEISEEEISEISQRISNLEAEEIDELFHELGFVVSKYKNRKRPEGYEALFPEQIKRIQSGDIEIIRNLLFETDIEDVKRELEKIE